jgi:hypothetical protein
VREVKLLTKPFTTEDTEGHGGFRELCWRSLLCFEALFRLLGTSQITTKDTKSHEGLPWSSPVFLRVLRVLCGEKILVRVFEQRLGGFHFPVDAALHRLHGVCALVLVFNDPVHFAADQDRESGDVEPQHQDDHRA